MSARVEARVSHRFSAPAERVFDAWLQPHMIRAWMSAALEKMGLPGALTTVEVDVRVGGAFEFADMRDGGEARHWGTYLTLDRPRTLSFTWITDASEEANPSVVTITIESEGRGCFVELVHDIPAEWKDYVKQTELGWSNMLATMDAVAQEEGGA